MSKAIKEAEKLVKPDYSYIPRVFMDQLSYCMMAGAKKYGRGNYLDGYSMNELTAAATRHLKLMEEGEDIDQDCTERLGKPVTHAACVAASMLMLLHMQQYGTLIDDRIKLEEKTEPNLTC